MCPWCVCSTFGHLFVRLLTHSVSAGEEWIGGYNAWWEAIKNMKNFLSCFSYFGNTPGGGITRHSFGYNFWVLSKIITCCSPCNRGFFSPRTNRNISHMRFSYSPFHPAPCFPCLPLPLPNSFFPGATTYRNTRHIIFTPAASVSNLIISSSPLPSSFPFLSVNLRLRLSCQPRILTPSSKRRKLCRLQGINVQHFFLGPKFDTSQFSTTTG